jgi:putative glutamine amidotransferase
MIETLLKIGVTFTGTDEKHNNYVKWLQVNELVEITRLSLLDNNLDMVNELDGIVLSGGLDMHPKYYHSDIINYPNAPEKFDENRDEFEIAVFELSQRKRIPVLCVCRGMQLVNCILGGTLTQDIGPAANGIHQYQHNDKAHGINILPGTLLNEITGLQRTVTNSAHHQSINKLGKGLVVNCTSDDGIIEGIEWECQDDQSFLLGVQWHPERMFKFHLEESPVSKNIRDWFINEIKKSIEILL